MNLLRAITCLLVCALFSSCRGGKIRSVSRLKPRTLGSVSWRSYCGCLHLTVTSSEFPAIKRCYKSFFKGNIEIKRAIRKYRNKQQMCFEPSKVDDEECKVVRRSELAIKYRRDIIHLVREMGGHLNASSSKVIMFGFWRQHPDIYEVCQQGANSLIIARNIIGFSGESFNDLKTGSTVATQLAATQLAAMLGDEPLGPHLTEQIKELCYRNDPAASNAPPNYVAWTNNFCDLDVASTLVKKMNNFTEEALIPNKWTDDKLRNFYDGLRLNFVALAEYSPDRYETSLDLTNSEKENAYKNNINTIVELVRSKDFDQLKMLTTFLPDDILTCSGSNQTTTEACYFKKILDQLVTYVRLANVTIEGKRRVMLSTGTNYLKLLEFRQMNRILTVVQQNQLTTVTLAEDITNSNNQRFTELKGYFDDLHDFNDLKADADIDFIDDWITKYGESVAQLVTENSHSLTYLLKAVDAGVKAEVAEKTVRMALAVAESCNPLKTLFGGSSIGDIADATADFTVAISNLNIAEDLNDQLGTLINKAVDMGTRFAGNSDDIKKVMDLVRSSDVSTPAEFETQKRQFIQLYGAYSPKVRRPELAEMDSYWDNVVDTACGIIFSFNSMAATLVSSADVKKTGKCWKIKVSIAKMTTTYEEIYDFQFDLMETLGSAMRAKIGKREASNIASNFESFPERENDNAMRYRSIYTLSYLTYNIQTWNIIKIYCDKLEYAEGGVRPRECKAESTNLPLLMSRPKNTCTGDDTLSVRIPISPGAGEDKSAFLNITNLYKEEHVTFQITNKQWLVDNKWISDSEKDKAIYIKELELFLPTVSEDSVTYISQVVATGENVLNPCANCTQYILPYEARDSKFTEGYEATCDEEIKWFPNPYTICRSNPLEEICRVRTRTAYPAGLLLPSIYARFRFKIYGYNDTPISEPANSDMYLKAKIKYCVLSPTGAKKPKTAFARTRTSRKCCTGNNYFSDTANQCTACPTGSEANLHGYYCEKNDNALMVD